MARIRSVISHADRELKDGLIDQVVKALDEQADEPVIFEIPLEESGSYQVIMVWERWAELPTDARTQIVIEAYQRAFDRQKGGVDPELLSMILPMTASAAIDSGVLPYSILFNVHPSQPNYVSIRKLLKGAGAIETSSGTELRLPTLQMAREARDNLQKETRDFEPEVHWSIHEQVGRTIDY